MKQVDAILAEHAVYLRRSGEHRSLLESIPPGIESVEEAAALDQRWRLVEKSRKDLESKFAGLIIAVESAYGVRPQMTSGFILGGPLTGVNAIWRPRLASGPEYATVAKDKANKEVFLGMNFASKRGRGSSATTLANGEVLIPIHTLEDVKSAGDPHWLAVTLYHESVHFTLTRAL